MPSGLDLEIELRNILERTFGWKMMASWVLDHQKKIDFIIVGYGTRYLSKPLEVQVTLQKKNAHKIGMFIERSRERDNGNVKVYLLIEDDLAPAAIAQAVHSALVRKMLSKTAPNGIYLLQVERKDANTVVGYWRDPFAYSLDLMLEQKAGVANTFRKRGEVIKVKDLGIVLKARSEQRQFFAPFGNIVAPLPIGRSGSCKAKVGDIVTFLPSAKRNGAGLPLAEFVRFKWINENGLQPAYPHSNGRENRAFRPTARN